MITSRGGLDVTREETVFEGRKSYRLRNTTEEKTDASKKLSDCTSLVGDGEDDSVGSDDDDYHGDEEGTVVMREKFQMCKKWKKTMRL